MTATLLILKGLFTMGSELLDLIDTIIPKKIESQQSAMTDMANIVNKNGRDYVALAVKNRFDSPALQAAILASIEHETGGSFDYKQKQYGGGPGRGLIQMEGGMLDGYQNYLKKKGMSDSVDSQLDFLKDIIESGNNYDIGAGHRQKFQKAVMSGNPELILQEFTNRVERPGKPMMDSRYKALKNWVGNNVQNKSDQNQDKQLSSENKRSRFNRAFADAKKSGKKIFEFEGEFYKVEMK